MRRNFQAATCLLILALLRLPLVSTTKSPSELLDKLLSKDNYDPRIRPNFKGPSVNVTLDVFINSFGSIQASTMDYKVNIFLRQRWNDPRLMFHQYNESLSIDPSILNKIWMPDLFFANEKGAQFHSVTTMNRLFRVSPLGDILYSLRLTLRLACPMQLQRFPMDHQICSMELESFGYTTRDLQFKWNDEDEDSQPVQLSADVELPQFEIERVETASCLKSYSTGLYTCVKASFYLKRQLSYFMMQTYTPTILIVVLSWVSFWINMDAAPARVGLGITTVLTMTTKSTGVSADLPKVSYVKAIDIWMAVCMMFVFAALLEFAAVNFTSRLQKIEVEKWGRKFSRKKQPQVQKRCIGIQKNIDDVPPNYTGLILVDSQDPRWEQVAVKKETNANENETSFTYKTMGVAPLIAEREEEVKAPPPKPAAPPGPPETFRDKAEKIDAVSRILFPTIFLLFNIGYWSSLLTMF